MTVGAAVFVRTAEGAVLVDILVAPRASRGKIGPIHDSRLKVAVTSPPVDGEANKAIVELFAKALKIARRRIVVHTGSSSRRKTLRIEGIEMRAIKNLTQGLAQ